MMKVSSMKKLVLKRTETSPQGTFGKLYDGNTLICYTGELPKYAGNPDVLNERRTDCIPTGTYVCKIKQGSKFGIVYRLENVPNRSEILIHKGNYAGSKIDGYRSDIEGCILLGTEIGILSNQKAVRDSKTAFDKFMKLMNKEPFEIMIMETFV